MGGAEKERAGLTPGWEEAKAKREFLSTWVKRYVGMVIPTQKLAEGPGKSVKK